MYRWSPSRERHTHLNASYMDTLFLLLLRGRKIGTAGRRKKHKRFLRAAKTTLHSIFSKITPKEKLKKNKTKMLLQTSDSQMAIIIYVHVVENEAARNDVISLYNWWIEKGKPNSFSLQAADFSILYRMHIFHSLSI